MKTFRRNGLFAFFGKESDGGQMIVMVAMVFLTLLFFVGLSVDVGQLYSSKRSQQEAADAASFAGSIVLYQGGSAAQAITAARTDAITNGFDGACGSPSFNATSGACTNSTTNTTVTVYSPPQSGTYATNPAYVEVKIVRQVRTTLVPAQSILNPVTAFSVAGAHGANTNGWALMTVGTTGTCMDFQNGSTGSIVITNTPPYGGQVMADCSGTAINHGGSGTLQAPQGISTVGTVSGGCCTGAVTTGVASAPDPYAGFPKPTASGANQTKTCGVPLLPGHYANLDTSTCGWVLTSGIYILRGGGIHLDSYGISEAAGSAGTMIFITNANYDGGSGGTTCNSVDLQGSGSIATHALSAPSQFAGMALYWDTACGATSISNQSNGFINVVGTVYGGNVTLNLNSSGPVSCTCQLVVKKISIQAQADLTIYYDSSKSASPVLPAIVR
jgi:Flp pilus assembly protein TadG